MPRLNPDSFYVDGVTLPAAYWQALDTAQSQAWNGDVGSSHNPSQPIVIAGAGMWFTGVTTFSGTYPNGVVFSATAPLVHGTNDWFLCTAGGGRTRTPLQGLARSLDCSHTVQLTTVQVDAKSQSITPPTKPSLARMRYLPSVNGVSNVCPGGTGDTADFPSYYTGGRIQMPLRVHHRSTIANVSFNLIIAGPRSALPANQPLFRVIQVDAFGNVTPLLTNATNGWVSLGAGSPAAYYNGGGMQQFLYTCDPNVRTDITQFTYWVQITDESDVAGGNAMPGNQFLSVGAVFNAIGDLRPA